MPPDDAKSLRLETPLEKSLVAGDIAAVMDLIDAMDPAERAAAKPAVAHLTNRRWELLQAGKRHPLDPARTLSDAESDRAFRAIDMARFMCDEKLEQCDYWMHINVQDIPAFQARFRPALSSTPIDKQVRADGQWSYRHRIHPAIVAGLVERPQTQEYIDALFSIDIRASTTVLRCFEADPGMAPFLLQLFEHEGTADGSFAAHDKYNHSSERSWSHTFLTLCERGVYTRAQLLDKTLGALACDWPQFKSGWFSRFHEQLAPTVDEMAMEAERYLALCHSRIAPTAGMALQAVAALYQAGRVEALAVCQAATPLVSATAKGQVLAALELLGQVANMDAALAHQASGIAAQALGHTAADVHKKAIAFLAKWGLDGAGQDLARSYLPFVSAVNRPALAKLVGKEEVQTAPAPATAAAHPAAAQPRQQAPLDPCRAQPAITQIPDVVERLAYVLENPADVDEWERVAAALVRLAPIAAADKPAFLALQKRTKKLDFTNRSQPFAISRVLAAALDGETTKKDAMCVHAQRKHAAEQFLGPRTHGLIDLALKGRGLTPLSTPTHRGGFIDPRELVARLAQYQQAKADVPVSEQVLALMRLVPATIDATAARTALAEAQALQDTPLLQALRYALGDGAVQVPGDADARPLFLTAARIRSPQADDAGTLAAYGDLGPGGPLHARLDWHVVSRHVERGEFTFHDLYITHAPTLQPQEPARPHHLALALCAKHLPDSRWATEHEAGHIRFAASLLPADLEPFFAEGALNLGNNVDWWEAQWHNRAYLDVLLDHPATMGALGPMARLLLAVALAGKEPGQTALAVDALVQVAQDGRMGMAALGDTLARLWATPLVKGARYAKSLAAAAQAGGPMPGVVFALLCAMVEAPGATWRKDLAPLLELLLELHLAHGLALPASTTAALAAMKPSAKGKAAQQKLLGK